MTVKTARQPMGTDVFNAENRRRCERYVRLIQGRLDKAVADNDKEKIRWYVHLVSQIHHMIPRAEGGTERLNNLRLLHVDCHNKVHSVFLRNHRYLIGSESRVR